MGEGTAAEEPLAETRRPLPVAPSHHGLQIAEVLRSRLIALARRSEAIVVPQLDRRLELRGERDVRIAASGTPNGRVGADETRDPEGWMRLLEREHPGI